MPEYLAPGVYMEEVSFRHKSIEGVGTSVAAVVGPTRTGPLRGKPEVVTSFAEFARMYGGLDDLSLGGKSLPNYTAIGAKAFFDNGGKQLFVARVIAGVNATDADGSKGSAAFGGVADKDGVVSFASRFPGAMGNYTLEFSWRDSENLLKSERPAVTAAVAGKTYLLQAVGVAKEAKNTGALADNKFPVDIQALVELDGVNLRIKNNRAVITSQADPKNPASVGSNQITVLDPAKLPANAKLTRVYAKPPTSGQLADGAAAEIVLNAEADLSAYTGASHWGNLRVLRGALDKDGVNFTVKKGLNLGVGADLTLPLSALAAASASAIIVLRNFDLSVREGGADGEVVYTYADLSTSPDAGNSLAARLVASPKKRYDALTSPLRCTLKTGATGDAVLAALYSMFNADALSPAAGSLDDPRYLITLTGGTDGDAPGAADYGGESDEIKGSTGLTALEDIEDISIVITPAAAAHAETHQAVVAEVQKHCRRMRYRVGVVDAQADMSLSEVRDFRSNFDTSQMALYYPWVVIADPTGAQPTVTSPPSGFVAGVYANTDVTRGVHKPPANEPVLGVLRFAQEINKFQQELLNPNGINCLRSFPGRGHRVWGGRTLSSDPEWKYVNVRRYFNYLERSIEKSTQWAVFEPNGESLWANIKGTVEDFLYNEWKNGRLLGGTPKEAYFVRCDRSTMTQNEIDNGVMVCVVGVAALKPAEFVVFRIGQKTADA
ncbi:MAG: phage tail sheath family protein [Betaproteobacteria bacterium]|nr:phage tail sheath family protein [Betaproteobacteria bacterium]